MMDRRENLKCARRSSYLAIKFTNTDSNKYNCIRYFKIITIANGNGKASHMQKCMMILLRGNNPFLQRHARLLPRKRRATRDKRQSHHHRYSSTLRCNRFTKTSAVTMPADLFNACIQPTGTVTLKNGTMSTDDDDEEPIECNYDTDLITLYQALEEKAWIPALDLIESNDQDSKDQVRTWVTRYEANGNVRWSQLPIHAAMIFQAPFKVVQALVEAYPKGVRCTDDQHMLPLHLAFRYGVPDNTLLLLLEAFPEAMNAKNRKGRVPALCACPDSPHRSKIVRYHIDNTKQVILEDRPDKKVVNKQITEMEERLETQSKKMDKLEAEKEEWEAKQKELQAKIADLEEKLAAQEVLAATALANSDAKSISSTKSGKASVSAGNSAVSAAAVTEQEPSTEKSVEVSEQVPTTEKPVSTDKSVSTKKSSSTKGSSGSDKSKKSGKTEKSTGSKRSVRSSISSKIFHLGKKKNKKEQPSQ